MLLPTAPHAQDIAGPSAGDPLTPDELSILLALPRAAQTSPDSLLVRLPKGLTPSEGHVDVSCSQACSIVARLAALWRTRTRVPLGVGTTVCFIIDPYVYGIFHQLAFWALGCTVQYVAEMFGDETVDTLLEQSGCKLIVHFGKTEAWVGRRSERHAGIEVIALDESECANTLAIKENSGLGPAPEWPTPKRPMPAVIVHSSSTTSSSKLLSFTLHYYTLGLAATCRRHISSLPLSPSTSHKRPQTHPRLSASAPFWQTFHLQILIHLVTATPFAFVPSSSPLRMPTHEFVEWVKEMDAGGLTFAPFKLRDLLLDDTYTELLRTMYSITLTGSVVDDQLSDLIKQKGINAANILGMSELGLLMMGNRAPYTHLRPLPDFPHPEAVPVSDSSIQHHSISKYPSGREVQLWFLVSRCPRLAHLKLQGGVPLNLQPFPGEGPHKGEPAMNLEDIFLEVRSQEGDNEVVAYIHLGRMDACFRQSNGGLGFTASLYEADVEMLAGPKLATISEGKWRFDAAQLFGSNLPKTALVVQLQSDCETQVDDKTAEVVRQCVEETNERFKLRPGLRVDPVKRMLITVRAPEGSAGEGGLCLSLTHKHTLRRWQNAKIFGEWLNRMDWS